MASMGWVGACPIYNEGSRRCLVPAWFLGRVYLPATMRDQAPTHPRETMMRFYNATPHRFYCGIDLHARTMHVCILDHDGNVVVDRGIATNPKAFLELIAPYRNGIIVGVECMFAWYWLADLCQAENIAFVLEIGRASCRER